MSTATDKPFPHPNDHPHTDVLIYDGKCQFCSKQVRRLANWDRQKTLSFLSLHDPLVFERYPDLTHDQLMEAMVLVTQQGKRYSGAAAFRCLTRKLPRLWILIPLLHIPLSLPLWQWVYRKIARQRYRWNKNQDCDDGQCSIHFPD